MARPSLSPHGGRDTPTTVKLGPLRADAERLAQAERVTLGEIVRRGVALYVQRAERKRRREE